MTEFQKRVDHEIISLTNQIIQIAKIDGGVVVQDCHLHAATEVVDEIASELKIHFNS